MRCVVAQQPDVGGHVGVVVCGPRLVCELGSEDFIVEFNYIAFARQVEWVAEAKDHDFLSGVHSVFEL